MAKWPKDSGVVQTHCAGSVTLSTGTPWADDAAVVRERPDLFQDEPARPLAGGRVVETTRQAPGDSRVTGVVRGNRRGGR